MKLSERASTWVMRLYPPLFFQRIWVKKFHKGFTGVDVVIHYSFFNRNSNGSIFGGTIFAATDPLYAFLFGQLFARKGYKTIVWLKSARIQYIKPAKSNLYIHIKLSEAEIEELAQELNEVGKIVKNFSIELRDKRGEICAIANNEVYLRDLNRKKPTILEG